jgi:hypothetical protein
MSVLNEEARYMASLSTKYLVREKKRKANGSGKNKRRITALSYSVKSDLLPLLMETGHKMDRLPIVYLIEANA